MDFYKGNIPIIETDSPATDFSHPPDVGFGCVERDYSEYPEPMFQQPDQMELIPESDWDAWYDMQEETQSSLEHLYLSGPGGTPAFQHLDQNGFPDCWAYSPLHSIMLDRLKQNLPVIRFNGTAAATMMNQLSGGWCGMSAQFYRRDGCPIIGNDPGEWPEWTRNRKYDTPELRANMARFKIEEEWTDLTKRVYDQNLTRNQCATCGFNNIPGPRDYNWWSHSVTGVRWVRVERGSWGQLILNQWANWGRFGLAVLRGSKSVCNGGLGIRLSSGAAA